MYLGVSTLRFLPSAACIVVRDAGGLLFELVER